jgi:hypothetical protein
MRFDTKKSSSAQNSSEFLTRDVKSGPELWIIKKDTMEKRVYTAAPINYCTCSNQWLLMPGCECELCMGIVADLDASNLEPAEEKHDRYDQAYFEALERMYSSFEFAA